MTQDHPVRRKQTFRNDNRRPGGKRPPAKPRKISGHEKMLHEVTESGENVVVENMRGEVTVGRIIGFDSYTITIREHLAGGQKGRAEITIFKHAIESIARGELVAALIAEMEESYKESQSDIGSKEA